tara:strand:- start:1137 stop:1760 length:624 start_codon:yes stop_codon:yes gene_type:complete
MFWLEDPLILFNDDFNFNIPSDLIGRLNFFFKYVLILSIILTILFQDANFLLLAIVFALLTILIYYHDLSRNKEKYTDETAFIDNKVCTNSTFHNPFMNPSVYDISNNPNKPDACNIEKVDMNSNFYEGVFRSTNDIFDKESSLRQFYTVPSTSIPNKQKEFAEWLYNEGPSCKEGNYDRCVKNINLDRTDLNRVGIASSSAVHKLN